jgi:hypothetical protein
MRYEYKYLVKNEHLPRLRQMVLPFVDRDKYALKSEEGEYTVRSIYFETPGFDFYNEKVAGIPNRKKLRIRGYNQPEGATTVFLEIKRKYQVPSFKYRAPLRFEDAKMIFRGHAINEFVTNSPPYPEAETNARRFFFHIHNQQLRPTVLVVYEREAYQEKLSTSNGLRITFDKNLRSAAYPALGDLFLETGIKPALTDHFVLEIKFNQSFPGWILPMIDSLSLKRQAVSKYVVCVDSQGIRRFRHRYSTQPGTHFFHHLESPSDPNVE